MSGEFLTVTLAAGETKPYQKAGRYFEITADGGSTFNFVFYGPNGAIQSNINKVQAGIFLEDPWNSFSVTNNSTAPQSITMLLMDSGRGGSRRQPGVVSVVNAIGAGVQRTTGAGSVVLTALTVTQIVDPTTNLRGMTIRRAIVSATQVAGGTTFSTLWAAPVAPVSLQPTNAYPLAGVSAIGAGQVTDSHVDQNYQIPVGWGVWLVQANTTNPPTQNNYEFVYEIL